MKDPDAVETHLKFLRVEEAIRVLDRIFLHADFPVEFGEGDADGMIEVRSPDKELRRKALGILSAIDVPVVDPLSRFVKVKNRGCEEAASLLGRRLKVTKGELQFLPDPRTNRIFLMGDPGKIREAEELLADIDGEKRMVPGTRSRK